MDVLWIRREKKIIAPHRIMLKSSSTMYSALYSLHNIYFIVYATRKNLLIYTVAKNSQWKLTINVELPAVLLASLSRLLVHSSAEQQLPCILVQEGNICTAQLLQKRWWSNINVLFGISFTLQPNKKLTTRINCFHLCSVTFQSRNLYVGHLC